MLTQDRRLDKGAACLENSRFQDRRGRGNNA